MPAPTFSTFLFDLDGTLIDSIDLILSSYRHTLKTHRGLVPSDDVWLAGLGTPLRAQFSQFTDDPDEIEAMVATYRDHNFEHHDALVREFPGVREAVQALGDRGARLGVVTSKKREGTLLGLQRCGFDGLFDVLVCADDVARHKPEPEPVLRALTSLDAQPKHAVFVGDSPHDLVAGRKAGVATAAVLWGPFPRQMLEPHDPDFWVAEPSELTAMGDG
ncbi:MAG: HAD-IA family hydrolase [Gemmatimonadales bacterium]|nr:HAD-IA family hydrolase [Gemmatimonadales bacterium]NIN12020.1 HAD-IA family hydrolase [Gemmatimonadales bacterium]NIN50551.1 HAD-IA family hydrolase [Gemmatimonadales bacterium]NIP08015.1 HAD-IA family hydrolase [Gemmatimonadales bacterium]NIR02027.1 HAD-IA family hydrolase [Gemmatimonadales bacterium]